MCVCDRKNHRFTCAAGLSPLIMCFVRHISNAYCTFCIFFIPFCTYDPWSTYPWGFILHARVVFLTVFGADTLKLCYYAFNVSNVREKINILIVLNVWRCIISNFGHFLRVTFKLYKKVDLLLILRLHAKFYIKIIWILFF